jgi:hypothetical protein
MTKTLLATLLFVTLSSGAQETPTWASAATPIAACGTEQRFTSPDRTVTAELRCHRGVNDGDPRPYLRVTLANGHFQDVNLQSDYGGRPQELLWSPDSKAFFVNGSESAYAGFFVDMYRLDGDSIQKLDVTSRAQRDMVRIFTPCRAENIDKADCRRIERSPKFNMSGLIWAGRSSAIVVIAEIPCSSTYGGIMCQVLGYKLATTDGRILQRLSVRELKDKWQEAMAWEMKTPERPKYKSATKK